MMGAHVDQGWKGLFLGGDLALKDGWIWTEAEEGKGMGMF